MPQHVSKCQSIDSLFSLRAKTEVQNVIVSEWISVGLRKQRKGKTLFIHVRYDKCNNTHRFKFDMIYAIWPWNFEVLFLLFAKIKVKHCFMNSALKNLDEKYLSRSKINKGPQLSPDTYNFHNTVRFKHRKKH